DELGEASGLADKAQIAVHRPRVMLRVAKTRSAGEQKHLRHLALVQIPLHRGVGRRAERAENAEDLLLLDEPPGLFYRLGRAVAVVERDELDLAAVDPAGVVDHAEICRLGAPDRGERRGRTAIGYRLADLDLCVGNAGRVLALRRARLSCDRTGNRGDQHEPAQKHRCPPQSMCGITDSLQMRLFSGAPTRDQRIPLVAPCLPNLYLPSWTSNCRTS